MADQTSMPDDAARAALAELTVDLSDEVEQLRMARETAAAIPPAPYEPTFGDLYHDQG